LQERAALQSDLKRLESEKRRVEEETKKATEEEKRRFAEKLARMQEELEAKNAEARIAAKLEEDRKAFAQQAAEAEQQRLAAEQQYRRQLADMAAKLEDERRQLQEMKDRWAEEQEQKAAKLARAKAKTEGGMVITVFLEGGAEPTGVVDVRTALQLLRFIFAACLTSVGLWVPFRIPQVEKAADKTLADLRNIIRDEVMLSCSLPWRCCLC
jgi:hypothetical protein